MSTDRANLSIIKLSIMTNTLDVHKRCKYIRFLNSITWPHFSCRKWQSRQDMKATQVIPNNVDDSFTQSPHVHRTDDDHASWSLLFCLPMFYLICLAVTIPDFHIHVCTFWRGAANVEGDVFISYHLTHLSLFAFIKEQSRLYTVSGGPR